MAHVVLSLLLSLQSITLPAYQGSPGTIVGIEPSDTWDAGLVEIDAGDVLQFDASDYSRTRCKLSLRIGKLSPDGAVACRSYAETGRGGLLRLKMASGGLYVLVVRVWYDDDPPREWVIFVDVQGRRA